MVNYHDLSHVLSVVLNHDLIKDRHHDLSHVLSHVLNHVLMS